MSLAGTVEIILESPSLKYNLVFDRNISVIRGDSGTGKSRLCELIEQALEGAEGLSLSLKNCDHCVVMPAVTVGSATVRPWYDIIDTASNTVFFIDEFCDCLHSGDFSRSIKGTTNYYILITRESHSELPYSVHSMYDLIIDGTANSLEQRVIVNTRYVDNNNLALIDPGRL